MASPPPGFTVDLLQCAKEHIFFLQRLHPHFIQKPSTTSLRRYRDLWLPLVRARPTLSLVPPPDIAWLWHCHRLAPFRYTSYLRGRYGAECPILEANPPFCFQWPNGRVCIAGEEREDDELMSRLAEETKNLWKDMWPNEPYFLSNGGDDSSRSLLGRQDLLIDGFDLLASTDRQATFLWQVSGPRFSDEDFLHDAVSQYHKFLKLRKGATKGTVLVPTYQIDLMWHSHILANISGYFTDCMAIMGCPLNHDDSLNDRSEDGPLDRAFQETKALWKKNYDEEYFAEGGMYRGEPPVAYYLPSWDTAALSHDQRLYCPTGVFSHLIDVQGASSTNPSASAPPLHLHDDVTSIQGALSKTNLSASAPPPQTQYRANNSSGSNDWDSQVIWTWKETPARLTNHPSSSIIGDPNDCWIKYDGSANLELEDAYMSSGGKGVHNLGNRYVVDFTSMKQTNVQTGYQRDVQRIIPIIEQAVPVQAVPVKPVVWCWKETSVRMPNHPTSSVVGDPKDCWIKYDDNAVAKLEFAYQVQGQVGECLLDSPYTVSFDTMKQKNLVTGYEREVQRVDEAFPRRMVWYWRDYIHADPPRPHGQWKKFDALPNAKLEAAFREQGPSGTCSPITGYSVDFTTMKQSNIRTGYQRDVQRGYDNSSSAYLFSWTPVTGTAPDGLAAFVEANEKSTTRGLNQNPFRDNYIFGKKSTYTGYFHITTKEAYEVMAARVGVRLKSKEVKNVLLKGVTLGMMSKESKIKHLKDIQAIAVARANAPKPGGVVGLPTEIQNDTSKRKQHYSDAGDWLFPQAYYSAAGGCGAGTVRGGGGYIGGPGGCSAGACVACGCGGGACGGGGCGGGKLDCLTLFLSLLTKFSRNQML